MRALRSRKTALAAGAAALMLVPAAPVSASTAAETCHPPNYDTVHCICVAVGRVWIKVTGGDWSCA